MNRVTECKEILHCLSLRSTMRNLIIIDEKLFFDRPVGCRSTRHSWLAPGGDVPQFPRRGPMEKKFMAIVAITFTGLCNVQVLPRNTPIDSALYIQFLQQTLDNFNTYDLRIARKAITPENCIIMADNARPHISTATTEFLRSKCCHILKQPAYSPDLNMLDRMFFPKCEMKRSKINFSSPEEIDNFIRQCATTNTEEIMLHEYEKLKHHCQQVIDSEGNYI